jgi:signal transduction histidine kinase
VLGKLSITQKLAVAVLAPLVVLGGVTLAGFSTFQRVKVNGPEYKKLSTTGDLVADVLPPPMFILEMQLQTQSMLRADEATFGPLEESLAQLKNDYQSREKYWTKNLTAIGEPELQQPFLTESASSANEYFTVVEKEFLPALKTAYAEGWNPRDPEQFEVFASANEAQVIFDTKLTPLFVKHGAAINKTVALSVARRSTLETEVKSTVASRLTSLGLFALFGTIATFLFGSFIAQAVRRSLKAVTDAANRAARTGLPETVAAIQSATEDSPVPELERVPVESNDELGELATALNSMQDTAVMLASEQALVRRNVSQNLVNLARRNQALLGRSLNLLTRLEQDERDPDKLQDLFRVDHLTTRMRRNADSLLVLAGAEPTRKWSESVDLGDVIRAAVSAIEAFDRVDIVGLDAVDIKGANVNDIAHLIAELIENATNFSPPDSRVAVIGRVKSDGYLLVITDDGLGMSPEDLEAANARINSYTAFESTPSRVLGLNVVGRLASRLGIDVSLAESATAGIAARIVLPAIVLDGFEPAIDPHVDATIVNEAFGTVALDPALDYPAFDSSAVDAGFPTADVDTPQSPWVDLATQANHDGFVPVEGAYADNGHIAEVNGFETISSHEVNASEASDITVGAAYDLASTDQIAVESSTAELATPVESIEAIEPTIAAEHNDDTPDNVRAIRRPGLSKRVRGAQMVDTGPDEVDAPEDPSEERPAAVMSSLSNLQQGLARGRSEHPSNLDSTEAIAVAETEHASVWADASAAVDEVVSAESVSLEEAIVEAAVVEEPVVEAAVVEEAVVEAAVVEVAPVEALVEAVAVVEEPKRKTLLGRRVRGAQLPDTGPITDRTQVNDSNPEEIRSALGSLQRGVASGVAAVESGIDTGLSSDLQNVDV